jgi:hypothetical protein
MSPRGQYKDYGPITGINISSDQDIWDNYFYDEPENCWEYLQDFVHSVHPLENLLAPVGPFRIFSKEYWEERAKERRSKKKSEE